MRPIIGVTCPWSEETWGKTIDGDGFDYAGRAYSAAIYKAGGMPLLLPVAFSEDDMETFSEEVLSRIDGLYFTGGGNRKSGMGELPTLFEQQPMRSRWEALLLQKAYAKDLPCIGTCRGYQMMAVIFGGAMDTQRFPDHKQTVPSEQGHHNIMIAKGSLLETLTKKDCWFVNSIHVESVKDVPPGFVATAWAEDNTIEAIEATDKTFFIGTQFHPELMAENPQSQMFFKGFIEAAK